MADDELDQDSVRETRGAAAPRHSRRLSDKILIAFHHGCDQGDYEVAERITAHPGNDADPAPGFARYQPSPQHGKPGRGA